MIILVQKSCLHNDCKRNQSRTKIPYYAVVCFTGGRHFLTISLDTAGLRRRVWMSGNFKDNCQLVVCYCISSDHAYRNSMELFIPIVHAVRHNPAVSRNILTKWQPPIWLGYRKAGVLHAAPTPPTVVAQAWFYIKSIVVLLLINTTTLQLQCFLLL